MTISIWGWGSSSITTWGWGTFITDYVPLLFGRFLYDGAWTWVIRRDIIEVRDQDSNVFLRMRPSSVLERSLGTDGALLRPVPDPAIQRSPGDSIPIERSQGWPWQTGDT